MCAGALNRNAVEEATESCGGLETAGVVIKRDNRGSGGRLLCARGGR